MDKERKRGGIEGRNRGRHGSKLGLLELEASVGRHILGLADEMRRGGLQIALHGEERFDAQHASLYIFISRSPGLKRRLSRSSRGPEASRSTTFASSLPTTFSALDPDYNRDEGQGKGPIGGGSGDAHEGEEKEPEASVKCSRGSDEAEKSLDVVEVSVPAQESFASPSYSGMDVTTPAHSGMDALRGRFHHRSVSSPLYPPEALTQGHVSNGEDAQPRSGRIHSLPCLPVSSGVTAAQGSLDGLSGGSGYVLSSPGYDQDASPGSPYRRSRRYGRQTIDAMRASQRGCLESCCRSCCGSCSYWLLRDRLM